MRSVKIILVLVLAAGGLFAFDYLGAAERELPIFVKEEAPFKGPRPLFVPGEIVVKFKPGVSENSIRGLEQAQGAAETYKSPFAGFRVLKIAQGQAVPDMAEIFQNNPLVEYAHPNYYMYASFVPDDTFYPLQWHFDNAVHGGHPYGSRVGHSYRKPQYNSCGYGYRSGF